MENPLHDPKKRTALIVGGIVVVLLFLYIRAKSAGSGQQQAPVSVVPGNLASSTPQFDLSPVADAFQRTAAAVDQSQQGIAAVSQNQAPILTNILRNIGLGSWISCVQGGDFHHIDANCLKIKGGVTVPGGQDVSNVKTQRVGDLEAAAAPFASCRMQNNLYDLACVGAKIAGNPSLQIVSFTNGNQSIVPVSSLPAGS